MGCTLYSCRRKGYRCSCAILLRAGGRRRGREGKWLIVLDVNGRLYIPCRPASLGCTCKGWTLSKLILLLESSGCFLRRNIAERQHPLQRRGVEHLIDVHWLDFG